MELRLNPHRAQAQLEVAIAAAAAAGVSRDVARRLVDRAYQPAMARLAPDVQRALRNPSNKTSVMVLEAVEADALTAIHGWPGHPASHIDFAAAARAADTVYPRDKTRREFAQEIVASRAFLNKTDHNVGADIIEFIEYDVDDALRVRLTQQKVGKTKIIDAAGGNRSMREIADKLTRAGVHVVECVEEEFDIPVELEFCLDTASPIAATALRRAAATGVSVTDADAMWQGVWPPPIKAALLEEYGTVERAKYLGAV